MSLVVSYFKPFPFRLLDTRLRDGISTNNGAGYALRFGVTTGIYLRTSDDSAKDQVCVSTAIDLEFFTFLLGSLHLPF
jgi:hypothetical protein